MSSTPKESYESLKKKFPGLPEWKALVYFAGIPKSEDVSDVYHITNLFRSSVSGLVTNFLSILTPNNFMALHDQKLCKDKRDEILNAVVKCGYILRKSMVDLMDAALEKDYEKQMAEVAGWVAKEATPSLEFFHKNTKHLAEKWKDLKIENNQQNHFSY
ncbi:MAG: hypothetical protein GOV00_00660 [Candidatus Altiarchaeota archaeon]|nr:hypothetical protein [Candidatus Altiarchaeota archaeon]